MEEKQKRYPLTHPQQRIWYSEKLHPGTGMWNNAGTVKIKGKVDYSVLEKAINICIRDNDAVRLRIGVEDGAPYQYLVEYQPVKIELKDFSELGVKKLYEWDELITQAPMPLVDSCLSFFTTMRVSEDEGWIYAKFHHIISDALSIVDFSNQIISNYHKLMGIEVTDIKLRSYLEFVEEEQEYLNSKRFESDRNYWTKMFEHIPEPTVMKQKKTNYFSTRARRRAYVMPAKISAQIRRFCIDSGVSVSTLFMSALAIYINRITGKRDIIIGTPVANRTSLHSRGAFGMYVSTVPLRLEVSDDISFAEFAKMVTGRWLAALKHQKYPYDLLMQDLRKEHKGLDSLYDVTLSYQSGKHQKHAETFTWESRWHFNGYQPNSLSIHVNDREGNGRFIIDYDHHTPFFSDKEIEYIHSHITNIITDITENPGKPLYQLNLMSEEERGRILNKFNNTSRDFPEGETLADMWYKRMAKVPKDAAAVVCAGKTLTYGELDKRSTAIAAYLKSRGVGPESIVGLVTERTEDYPVSVLAIIKAGAAFLPIDAELPQERIAYMLADSGAKAVLVSPRLESKCTGETEIISTDVSLEISDDMQVRSECGPDNLAYVIYTSGSTGQPKGVQIEHRSIVHFVYSLSEIWKFSAGARLLCAASISFDISVMELFLSLMNGAALILAQENEVNIPKNMVSLIKSAGVNMMVVTPGRMELLLSDTQGAACLKDFREIGLGGDILPEKLLAQIQQVTRARIINFYGPTEITVCATCTDVTKTKVPNIGSPMHNVKAYILDAHKNPVPIGIPGELYIGGKGVARGYINKPELNGERFIKNPFIPGQRLYRTGDLTRWYPLGEIEFLGRIDKQVKIRGYRIELGEVENRLLQVGGVTGCVVADRTDTAGRKYLCAYLTGNLPKKSEIKAQLVRDLPSYMIPSYFVGMEAFPMNSSGKVDKSLLPDPAEGEESQDGYTPPETATEQVLVDIWGNILNTQHIGRDDSFFDIGGDSLSIVQVMAEVTQAFHVDIRLEDVYRTPRLKDFAALIDTAEQISYRPIRKAPEAEDYPVSPAQQRMWVLAQSQPDSVTYNIPYAFSFKGRADIEKLSSALNKLAERHEALRTLFVMRDGELRQRILKSVQYEIECMILNNEKISAFLKKLIRPFDLGKAPLMRAAVVETGDDSYTLFFDMHHIIGDKHTVEVLLRDFKALYEGRRLLPKGMEYRDYALWQQEFLESENVSLQREYWRGALSGELPLLNMHTDKPRNAVQRFEGARIAFTIPDTTAAKLTGFAKQRGVTMFTVALAAYSLLLSKHTGQEEIIIGTPVSLRSREEIRDTAGVFLNTLPLRCFPQGDLSIGEYIAELQKASASALAHSDYPLERIISDAGIKRDTSRNPLFDTMIVFAREAYNLDLDKERGSFITVDTKTSKLDITFEMYETGGGFECQFEYNTRLFRRSTLKRMANHLLSLFLIVTEEPDIRLRDVSVMTHEEIWKVTQGFNQTDAFLDPGESIQSVFEKIVDLYGNKPALISGHRSMTYIELNMRANRIARKLREYGVTRNSIVALSVMRSFDMLAAMLGILKAGGGYMPLDISYPPDRLTFMLSDSGAKVLISDGSINIPYDKQTLFLKDIKDSGPCDNLSRIDGMEDIAYVMYTSGSTGKPKGTVLHRRGLLNFYEGVKKPVDYRPELTSITITTVSFDIFVCDAILPLLFGSTVVLCSEEELRQPNLVARLIEENDVKFIQATPTRMRILLESAAFHEAVKAHIEKIMLGGEMVPPSLLKYLKKYFKAQIINAYGPTETTVYSSFKDLTCMARVTIGKPITNTRIYVLDQYGRPVPIGVPGEGYISGAGVAHGYINRDELNRKAFLPDPYWPGQTMYRTGDICVFDENGELVMNGRIDNQIKIRGQRIELGEIEAAIRSVKGVEDVAVKDWGKGICKYLCAYYLADQPVNEETMRLNLLKRLPSYMVPSFFVHMKEMPMTLNGKISLKELLEPERIAAQNTVGEKVVMTDTEKKMALIWEQILKVNSVGPDSNFFSLGGDSLGVIKLQTAIFQHGWNIHTKDFFENPTLREVCLHINKNKSSSLVPEDSGRMEHIPEYVHLKSVSLKKILLTGATGYLGAYLLKTMADMSDTHIICLVRANDMKSADIKLRNVLIFYFGIDECSRIMKRVTVLTGDITKHMFGININEWNKLKGTDTIIHSAAKTDHIGAKKAFHSANILGTQNVIEAAKLLGAGLIHVSTHSVSGTYYISDPGRKGKFSEECYYIGQNYADNVYVESKFLAEECVLHAISDGLNARIMRVGMLTGSIDGMFQMRPERNAFANKINALCEAGIVPFSMLATEIEMTPVDVCAQAIFALAKTDTKQPVYHVFNYNTMTVADLVNLLEKCGYDIKVISDREIKTILGRNNSKDNGIGFSWLIDDIGTNRNIQVIASITKRQLEKNGFKWPVIDESYVNSFLNNIIKEQFKEV